MAQPAPTQIPLPDASLLLYPRLDLGEPGLLLQHLITETTWRQQQITLFGKTWPEPRLTAWYGDPGAAYTYSGLTQQPLPWTTELTRLREQIEAICQHRFNSVLLNYYRDGRDSMGMHADDEPELGPEPVIASLSLGETRRLRFKHRYDKDQAALSIPLPGGSLLVMSGTTQQFWKHGIGKTGRHCGPRINLTFRHIQAHI